MDYEICNHSESHPQFFIPFILIVAPPQNLFHSEHSRRIETVLVDYAKARCEKEKTFEERFFPSRALPFPNLFEQP